MRKHLKNKLMGFTLAEILIVLGVIGLIADMTIPVLMQSYQKKLVEVKLQKAYSDVVQAMRLSEAENGPMIDWVLPETSQVENTAAFGNDYLYKYFRIDKKCEPSTNECFKSVYSLGGEITPYGGAKPEHSSFITTSGASFLFWGNHPIDPPHAQIWVDIDGPMNGKSLFGKDIFGLFVDFKTGKVRVNSYSTATEITREILKNEPQYGCNKTAPTGGYNCGALIQMDGWQIKDDYPW